MYRNIALLVFILLTAIAAKFIKTTDTASLPDDKTQVTDVETVKSGTV